LILPLIKKAFGEIEPAAPMQPEGLTTRWEPIGAGAVASPAIGYTSAGVTAKDLNAAEKGTPTPTSSRKEKMSKKRKAAEAVCIADATYTGPAEDAASVDSPSLVPGSESKEERKARKRKRKAAAAAESATDQEAHDAVTGSATIADGGSSSADINVMGPPTKKNKKDTEKQKILGDSNGIVGAKSANGDIIQLVSSPAPPSAMKDGSKKKKNKVRHVSFSSDNTTLQAGPAPHDAQPGNATAPDESADMPDEKRRKRRKSKVVVEFVDKFTDRPKTEIKPPMVPGMPG
jgi:hypothetical protein